MDSDTYKFNVCLECKGAIVNRNCING